MTRTPPRAATTVLTETTDTTITATEDGPTGEAAVVATVVVGAAIDALVAVAI